MLFSIFLLFLGCQYSNQEARDKYANRNRDLKIGVSYSKGYDSGFLLEGIELALEDVSATLPKGKRLSLEVRDDEGNINRGIINATQLAEDPSVISVIGHTESYISIPASAIYEYNGIVMMNPYSTSMDLLDNGYEYIFRSIPSDESMAHDIVDYFLSQGLEKVNICYVSNSYGSSFANSFEKRAESNGMDISDRVSYDVGDLREFNRIVKKWENYEYDAILFVGTLPEGANFYKVLDERGIKVPVVSGEAMAEEELLLKDEDIVEGKLFPAIFHMDDPSSSSKTFAAKFKKKYGKEPDMYAALGYDSVKLIAHAIRESKSYAPSDISKSLKKMKNFKGVTNTYNFKKNGDLIMKNDDKIGMQKIENRSFKFLGSF